MWHRSIEMWPFLPEALVWWVNVLVLCITAKSGAKGLWNSVKSCICIFSCILLIWFFFFCTCSGCSCWKNQSGIMELKLFNRLEFSLLFSILNMFCYCGMKLIGQILFLVPAFLFIFITQKELDPKQSHFYFFKQWLDRQKQPTCRKCRWISEWQTG